MSDRECRRALVQDCMAAVGSTIVVLGAGLGAVAYTVSAIKDPETSWPQRMFAPFEGTFVGGIVSGVYLALPLWVLSIILGWLRRRLPW